MKNARPYQKRKLQRPSARSNCPSSCGRLTAQLKDHSDWVQYSGIQVNGETDRGMGGGQDLTAIGVDESMLLVHP